MSESALVRFERWYIPEPNSGCWLWVGATTANGYGWFLGSSKKYLGAHRWSYQNFVGQIPAGLHIDHLCRNRCCVNPAHLEPVTPLENISRSPIHVGAKTHCKQGHPLSGDNVRIVQGRRICITCKNKRWHEWKARQCL